jgi:hypothetical protein
METKMTQTLRGGAVTEDRRLDRLVHYDEQSRSYPIRTLVASKPLRSYTWRLPTYLDQGSEGACVGFSWSHELAARPKEVKGINNATALLVYKRARQLDEWAGENYDGTSVLAGAKAVQEAGYISEYRWAFSLDDALLAIGYQGPGILGAYWYEGCMQTDEKGFIKPTGEIVGGHAIVVRGINIKNKTVRLANSWGKDWGVGGDCFLTFDDFAYMLKNSGEFCIPVARTKK